MKPRQVIDDGYPPVPELSTGHAESSVEPANGSFDDVRAILWLPDPETRRGWREFYVRDPVPKKPGGRVGF